MCNEQPPNSFSKNEEIAHKICKFWSNYCEDSNFSSHFLSHKYFSPTTSNAPPYNLALEIEKDIFSKELILTLTTLEGNTHSWQNLLSHASKSYI